MEKFDYLICGAGVVGLAIASSLAEKGLNVALVEKEKFFGTGISSRNSEVIHAGIYYRHDSLKHRLGILGRKRLYEFADKNNVEYLKCGKLIVATDYEQQSALNDIYLNAKRNRVEGIKLISKRQIQEMEPEISAHLALHSAESGIIDSHKFMDVLYCKFIENGGLFAVHTEVREVVKYRNYLKIKLNNDYIYSKRFINCAGLSAIEVLKKCDTSVNLQAKYEYQYAKGSYFKLSGQSPFSSLIYPIPENGGLGIHSTIDLSGKTRFGPDIEWLPPGTGEEDLLYEVFANKSLNFKNSIAKYWPKIMDRKIIPDYAGIRPKLKKNGVIARDFEIFLDNLDRDLVIIHCLGIESPGLTASLGIAEFVSDLCA